MFILLKILLYFFRPLTWIIILMVFAVLTKNPRRKRIAFIISFTMLLFFSNPFIIFSVTRAHEADPVSLKRDDIYATGILLGGFVGYHKKDDTGYFNEAADRLLQTALLYKTNKISKILISAGNGYMVNHSFVEASFAKKHLVGLGVPDSVIYAEGRSRNTEENALYSRQWIDSFHLQPPYMLITSAFHIPRAQMVFRNAGIDATSYPCNFIARQVSNNFFEDYILPSSSALRMWDSYIKEQVGIAVYRLKGKG